MQIGFKTLLRTRDAMIALCLGLAGLNNVHATPTLQLDIGGGTYDPVDETIITMSGDFTLYAYAHATGSQAIDVSKTHYISIALTPSMPEFPAPDFGSFIFAGNTFDISDMTYGVPPIEMDGSAEHDGTDLGQHGIFETYFYEYAFTFNPSQKRADVNTRMIQVRTPPVILAVTFTTWASMSMRAGWLAGTSCISIFTTPRSRPRHRTSMSMISPPSLMTPPMSRNPAA
jgi:hypothetical protein